MTIDRSEDVRFGAAREKVVDLVNDCVGCQCSGDIEHEEHVWQECPNSHPSAKCPRVAGAFSELERAAAESAVCALPCYHLNCCGHACPEIAVERRYSEHDHWEYCPTCTARRAREEAT